MHRQRKTKRQQNLSNCYVLLAIGALLLNEFTIKGNNVNLHTVGILFTVGR